MSTADSSNGAAPVPVPAPAGGAAAGHGVGHLRLQDKVTVAAAALASAGAGAVKALKPEAAGAEQHTDSHGQHPIVINVFTPDRSIELYLKTTSIPAQIVQSHYPYNAATGYLPQLKHGRMLVTRDEILQYLHQIQLNRSQSLTSEFHVADADMIVYSSMIQSTLADVLLFAEYGDDHVYDNRTYYWLGKRLQFPLNMVMPYFIRRDIVAHLKRVNMHRRDAVIRKSRLCYVSLDERLSGSTYLFGDTYVRALKHKWLRKLLAEQPNLMRFYDSIQKEHFPEDARKIDAPKPEEPADTNTDSVGFSFPVRKRFLVVGAGVVGILLVRVVLPRFWPSS